MRLSWLGAFWPVYVFLFVRRMFDKDVSRKSAIALWSLASAIAIGGISPFGLVHVVQYEPSVVAIYGPAEPALRIGLIIMILMILWTAIQSSFPTYKPVTSAQRFIALGFILYAISSLFTCAFLPLLGHYEFIEATSYASVTWTTFAVWHVFVVMQEKNHTLSELDIYKKNLINHVTHEFRTPLNVIESAVSWLSSDGVDPRLKISGMTTGDTNVMISDYLGIIDNNAKRLGQFIDDLLDLAAAQQSKIKFKQEDLNLKTMAQETLESIQPFARQEQVTLTLQASEIFFKGDEKRLRQILSNLLSNAIKAAHGGTVCVSITQEENAIAVSVKDNGIGLTSEQLPFVFESFYQAQTNTATHKGSGLGLAVAKAWVEAHGGKIWAESDGEGKGATVTFTLPVS